MRATGGSRTIGTVSDVRSLGRHDHACWAFEDPAEFHAAAHDFLRDGLAAGERVCFVGAERDVEAWLAAEGVGEAVSRGAASACVLDSMYAAFTPGDQLDVYRRATRAAVDAGYVGFRVAADVTELLRRPRQIATFSRYEQIVDQYMAIEPFSAICGFQRDSLPAADLDRLMSVHPVGNGGVPFRIFADVDGGLAIAGDLDMTSSDLLADAFAAADLPVVGDEFTLDATRLAFIDHRSLIALASFAAARDARLVLRTRKTHLARLLELLELRDVRVEVTR